MKQVLGLLANVPGSRMSESGYQNYEMTRLKIREYEVIDYPDEETFFHATDTGNALNQTKGVQQS